MALVMTCLERYQAGELQAVWEEIRGLSYPHLSVEDREDIQSVCDETMRRVRLNAGRLIRALETTGYQFGFYPDGEPFPGFRGPLVSPDPELDRKLTEIEEVTGPLPLSLRTFWAFTDTLCLIGKHPQYPAYADPLVVEPVDSALVELQIWLELVEDDGIELTDPFRLPIAPDLFHKDNISGGHWYGMEPPCGTVDALLLGEPHETTFVEYLRIAFQAKGFPGIKKPTEFLNALNFQWTEF